MCEFEFPDHSDVGQIFAIRGDDDDDSGSIPGAGSDYCTDAAGASFHMACTSTYGNSSPWHNFVSTDDAGVWSTFSVQDYTGTGPVDGAGNEWYEFHFDDSLWADPVGDNAPSGFSCAACETLVAASEPVWADQCLDNGFFRTYVCLDTDNDGECDSNVNCGGQCVL